MSKPIFIWRVPARDVANDRERFEEIAKNLQAKLRDYHVLTFTDPTIDMVQFECYNTTDMDTKSFEELKRIVSYSEPDDDADLNEWDATLNDGLEDL